jgi:hypothetical protein
VTTEARARKAREGSRTGDAAPSSIVVTMAHKPPSLRGLRPRGWPPPPPTDWLQVGSLPARPMKHQSSPCHHVSFNQPISSRPNKMLRPEPSRQGNYRLEKEQARSPVRWTSDGNKGPRRGRTVWPAERAFFRVVQVVCPNRGQRKVRFRSDHEEHEGELP